MKSIRGILIDNEESQPTSKRTKSYRRLEPVADQSIDANEDVQFISTLETLLVIESDDEEWEDASEPPSPVRQSVAKAEPLSPIVRGQNDPSTSSAGNKPESTLNIEPTSAPEFIFKCKYCSKRAGSVADMQTHWSQTHKFRPSDSDQLNTDEPFIFQVDKVLRCRLCENRVTMTSHQFHATHFHADQPIVVTEVTNPNRCGLCSYVGTCKVALIEHGKQKHPAPKESEQSLLNRPLVPIDAKSLEALLQMGYQGQYKCLYCEVLLDSKAEYERHQADQHQRMPPLMTVIAEPPRFACTICDRLADTEQEIVEHLQHHNMYKFHDKYQCVHCPEAFGTKGMVRDHCQKSHDLDTNEFQLTSIQNRLPVYRRMKILFANGLMVCKSQVPLSRWGNMTDIIRAIQDIDEVEMAEHRRAATSTADVTLEQTDTEEGESTTQNGKRRLSVTSEDERTEMESFSGRRQVGRRSTPFRKQPEV